MAARIRLRLLAVGLTAGLITSSATATKPVALQGSPGPPASGPSLTTPSAAELFAETTLGEPQFDTTIAPLPPNVPSLAFEATATSEFGDLVRLADIAHFVDSVTITMSSWAIRSDFPGSSPLGFTHPITLKLYSVDRSFGTPRPGDPIAIVTQPFLIPWRPAPDPASNSPLRPWRAADGNYYPGLAFTLTFDLGSLGLSLPDEVIFGISFNTQNFGPAPLGAPGPYNALHVGVVDLPPTAGADLEPDAVFWTTANARNYADGGFAGVNVFRHDVRWTPYRPAVRFNNSAYGILAITSKRLAALPAADAKTAAALDEAHALASWALSRALWDGNNRLRAEIGRVVFDLLADAVDHLADVADSRDPSAPQAGAAIEALLRVAETLAEMALGDSLIGGGHAGRFSRAQEAFEEAFANESRARFDRAIDEFGHAWREADLSLR